MSELMLEECLPPIPQDQFKVLCACKHNYMPLSNRLQSLISHVVELQRFETFVALGHVLCYTRVHVCVAWKELECLNLRLETR